MPTFPDVVDVPLEKINYFYGKNGTGKSSITKYIREHPDCLTDEGQNLIIYDKQFKQDLKTAIPGIYTFGSDNAELLTLKEIQTEALKECESSIELLEGDIKTAEESKKAYWTIMQVSFGKNVQLFQKLMMKNGRKEHAPCTHGFVPVPILLVDSEGPCVKQVADHILSKTEGYSDYLKIAATLYFVQSAIRFRNCSDLSYVDMNTFAVFDDDLGTLGDDLV